MNLRNTIATLLITVVFTSCSSGGSTDDGVSSPNLTTIALTTVTDESGQGTIEVRVPPGYSGFQAMAVTPDVEQEIRVSRVVGPAGALIIDGSTPPEASEAVLFRPGVAAVNVPLLYFDINPGTYLVTFQLEEGNNRRDPDHIGVPLRVAVTMKRDASTAAGAVRINFILVGPVSGSEDMRSGFESAFEVTKEIYSRGGIAIDPRWYAWAGPSTLPDPESGDPFYGQITNAVRPNAVNVVIGSDFRGGNGREFRYAMAGALPGPAVPTPWSMVVISATNITGADGKFNYGNPNDNGGREPGSSQNVDDEIRLAAEEIGRLVARYLGLQNVVNLNNGSTVSSADLIPDTPACTTATNCRLTPDAATNLMFPYPVQEYPESGEFNNSRKYYSREDLTPMQGAVLNRSVLVD